MKYLKQTTCALCAVALGMTLSSGAWAAGTDAGDTVENAVTLSYDVNAIAQTDLTTSVEFTVDRALSVLVESQDGDVVNVTPGLAYAGNDNIPALNFDVTNNSNDDIDLLIGVVDQDDTAVTGYAGNSGTGPFDGTTIRIAIDDNTDGNYDASADTLLTQTGNHFELPAASLTRDVPLRLLLIANVDAGEVSGEQATYSLVAAVANGVNDIEFDTNGNLAPGAAGGSDVADNIALEQDVFADLGISDGEDGTFNFVADTSSATQDSDSNGQHSDSSAFVVSGATLTVAKTVEVIWDPINGNKYTANNANGTSGNNPKAIPGAVMMYVVGVNNSAGASEDADSIDILDDLPDAPELINEGTSETVNIPDTVSIDFGAGPVAVDLPDTASRTLVNVTDCGGATTTDSFEADPGPEIDVSVGTCTAGQTGVVAYFVELQ